MLELTGCIPLDRIDYIHLNGLDSSTITVFKCQKKKRKRMSQRVTNYVGFWQIVALLYKSSNISFVTVWSVSAGMGAEGLHLRHNLIALRPRVVVGATCPCTALLICFNLIVRQLDESINRLSLICKMVCFCKAECGSQGEGTYSLVQLGQCGPTKTPKLQTKQRLSHET